MAREWMHFHGTQISRQPIDHHGQAKHHPPGTPAPTLDTSATMTGEQLLQKARLDELERIKRSIA